ncbi:hypothetical protein J6590_080236 [Homalodisca vitripennis]|nr:hypothetical protein J6590_080236 [Homalodisca vitripennis]
MDWGIPYLIVTLIALMNIQVENKLNKKEFSTWYLRHRGGLRKVMAGVKEGPRKKKLRF